MELLGQYDSDSSEAEDRSVANSKAAYTSSLALPSAITGAPSVPGTIATTKRPLPASSAKDADPSERPLKKSQNSQLHRKQTSKGLLLPPQLRGRANVVTEDLGKLFSHRKQNNQSDS